MDAISALHNRVSIAVLGGPAPDAAQRDVMLRAAMRAPDHGVLRPWRFLFLEGEQRERLGQFFVEARLQDDPGADDEALNKLRMKPCRAPLILVAVAETDEDHRVPVLEQIVATGAAVQNIMLAAHALGIGAMWRTGSMARHPHVKASLGFADKDEIVGFIYLGTPAGAVKRVPQEDPDQYLRSLPQALPQGSPE